VKQATATGSDVSSLKQHVIPVGDTEGREGGTEVGEEGEEKQQSVTMATIYVTNISNSSRWRNI
jgi:hypothetical protein